MTKVAYLECPTGVAGDMCLGALVHAGVPLDYLQTQLNKLGIADEFTLRVETVLRQGQAATKVHVDLTRPPDPSRVERTDDDVDPHLTFQAIAPTPPSSGPSSGDTALQGHGLSHGHSHDHHASEPHAHEHPPKHHAEPGHGHPPEAIAGTDLARSGHAHSGHSHGGRTLPDIEHLIQSAQLPAQATAWSLAIFRRLAEAEGQVHGVGPDQVHFHEVGATDAIVDIVGTCLGLAWLGIEELYCSALPTGGGTVWAAHGRMPVPTPAVLKLWEMRQVPIYHNGIERELVTPTGAAIATQLATQFGAPPAMRLLCVGLGAGSRELPLPNVLRLWIGERWASQGANAVTAQQPNPMAPSEAMRAQQPVYPVTQDNPTGQPAASTAQQSGQETVAVLETQIDDLTPQAIAYASEQLFAAGALEVFTQAIAMKKSRLGTLVTVICAPERRDTCETILFRETTTLGIRHTLQARRVLDRDLQTVTTPYGPVRVKVARQPGSTLVMNAHPEYEDCALLARQHQITWLSVHQAAIAAWNRQPKMTCSQG